VTGSAGGRHQIHRMTILAGCVSMVYTRSAFPAVGRLRMRETKLCRRPARRVMAFCAGHSRKQALVERRVLMTRRTFHRRTLEYIIDVALFTGHCGMRAIQLEGGKVMVKGGWLPAFGGMAGAAILAKRAIMVIVFLMAGKAGSRRAFENLVDVTGGAFHCKMFAFQLESR